VHICKFGKTVSESYDKNMLTKLYIDMYAYTGVAEIMKHFKMLVMRFSAKATWLAVLSLHTSEHCPSIYICRPQSEVICM